MPSIYYRNAQILREKSREAQTPCYRCGLEIDYTIRGRHRLAFSAGHIVARSHGGTDALANLRAEHYGCNAAAGNGTTRGLGSRNGKGLIIQPQSEAWP